MLSILPFYSVTDDDEIISFFKSDKQELNRLLNNHNLKKYVFNTVEEEKVNDYHTIDSFNNLVNNREPKLSVFHLNIRSLNKHSSELVNLLSNLKLNFDCICLTEINRTNINMYKSLCNDYVFHFIAPESGNIGGAGIFVKKD